MIRPRRHEQDSHFRDWIARQNRLRRCYGHCYITSAVASPNLTLDTFYRISGVTTPGPLSGFGHSTNARLICLAPEPHVYLVTVAASIEADIASTLTSLALAKNGTLIQSSVQEHELADANLPEQIKLVEVLSLKNGDDLTLWYSGDNNNVNLTVNRLAFTAVQID